MGNHILVQTSEKSIENQESFSNRLGKEEEIALIEGMKDPELKSYKLAANASESINLKAEAESVLTHGIPFENDMIGVAVELACYLHGYTHDTLANLAKISQGAVSKIIREISLPLIDTTEHLFYVLHLELCYNEKPFPSENWIVYMKDLLVKNKISGAEVARFLKKGEAHVSRIFQKKADTNISTLIDLSKMLEGTWIIRLAQEKMI